MTSSHGLCHYAPRLAVSPGYTVPALWLPACAPFKVASRSLQSSTELIDKHILDSGSFNHNKQSELLKKGDCVSGRGNSSLIGWNKTNCIRPTDGIFPVCQFVFVYNT